MDSVPAMIGTYTVEKLLGRGGMGRVYLAYSLVGEPVAVKVIRQDKIDAETRKRFDRETQMAQTVIGTSQVARFLDADPFADQPWLAMEYVAGATLKDVVAEHGLLAAPLVAALGVVIVDALRAIHDAGLIHRDLKPQNIIMSSRGPVVIDFGLGAFLKPSEDSLSSSGKGLGTPCYMAPEQLDEGTKISQKTDLHALGAILLYAATGKLPYGNDGVATLNRISHPDIPPDLDGLPAALEPLVSSLLAFDPENRPNVASVLETCRGLLTSAGAKMQDARRMLVAATFRESAAEAPRVSPSIEQQLAELAAKFGQAANEDRALDRAVGLGGVVVDEPGSEIVEKEVLVSAGSARPSSARERVADQLRVQYGRQLRLWSSSSRRPA